MTTNIIKAARKIARSVSSVLAASGLLWLGFSVAPNTAGADVYMLVDRAWRALSSKDLTPHPGGTRNMTINGVQVDANIFLVDREPIEAIKSIAVDYSERYMVDAQTGDPFAALDAAIEAASQPFSDDQLAMEEVSAMLGVQSETARLVDEGLAGIVSAIEKPFFSVSDDWAVYGRFPAATWTSGNAGKQFSWDRHSYRGLGFVVLATRDATSRSSVLWRLGFPEDFRWHQLATAGGGDAPGADIEGLSRFPGSRRIGSVGEEAAFGQFEIAAFIGGGSVTEHLEYFSKVLQREGFTSQPYTSQRDGSGWIVANRGKAQVSIFVNTSADRRQIIDVVQWRNGA